MHSLLATGGMGQIYRAEQEPIGREIALKVLRPKATTKEAAEAAQKRFFHEAATLARLHHPNTVTLHDFGEEAHEGEPLFYMAMELVDGRPLHQVLKEQGRLSHGRAMRVVWQVARSLREAHRSGVIHRDLKPSNIMLVEADDGESVKVLDFGIAKLTSGELESLTLDNRVVGSPRYMSPEQILQQDLDGRSDIYALGIVLHELIAGSPPFSEGSPTDTMIAHVRKSPPTFASLGVEGIPVEVQALVHRCLAKRPDDRFDDVNALMRALRRTEWVVADEEVTDAFDGREDSIATEVPVALGPKDLPELAAQPDPAAAVPPSGQSRSRPLAMVTLLLGLGLGTGVLTWAGIDYLGAASSAASEPGGLLSAEQLVDNPENKEWMRVEAPHVGAERPHPMIDAREDDGDVVPETEAEAAHPPVAAGLRTIELYSVPSGAMVWEGSAHLGQTPLRLQVPTDGTTTRPIELRSVGYSDTPVDWSHLPRGEVMVVELVRGSSAPR